MFLHEDTLQFFCLFVCFPGKEKLRLCFKKKQDLRINEAIWFYEIKNF